MFLELATVGFLVGQYIYHRITKPDPPKPHDRIQIPVSEEGVNIPMLFGRCLVRQPIVAWRGNASAVQIDGFPEGTYRYSIDITFVLGIPFENGRTRLHGVLEGDTPMRPVDIEWPPNVNGGQFEFFLSGKSDGSGILDGNSPDFTEFQVEFGDGNANQTLTSASGLRTSWVNAGIPEADVPSFRGYVFFHLWLVDRKQASFPSLSMEVSSYPNDSLDQQKIGDEANPADVLWHILTGKFGKLSLPRYSQVDYETFRACAETLRNEGHGYSRATEASDSADQLIEDILRQIDGVLYEDPLTGRICLKLIRPDYDPNETPLINPDNCERLENVALGSWTGLVNKIRVVFPNRADGYRDGSAVAHNQANAVGQDGIVREEVLRFPGVCTQELADTIAARELAARSRPIMKARAIVDRTFYRAKPGDVVRFSWPEWNMGNVLMRVGAVHPGESGNNHIALDLIQEFFYMHVSNTPMIPPVAPFPTTATLG